MKHVEVLEQAESSPLNKMNYPPKFYKAKFLQADNAINFQPAQKAVKISYTDAY